MSLGEQIEEGQDTTIDLRKMLVRRGRSSILVIGDLFKRRELSGASVYPLARYGPREGYRHLIEESCDLFTVTPYQLNRLLGCPHPTYIYRWLKGDRRMSSLYVSRLVYLHLIFVRFQPFWIFIRVFKAVNKLRKVLLLFESFHIRFFCKHYFLS